ncbi:MAG: metallopeptidase family protein [Alphaproteobacteria bacterium]|nr:metallopeptidase family protein [Alphaproteobacteria bacterium]MDX5370781.1 metallopeptidase family protein [Alphaproteobacteria bacterium]MDX5465193.1 metallopeptidase family protein [Alphaproteobacteria bacterium]
MADRADGRENAWAHLMAPSIDDLAQIAEDAFARLPEVFARRCGDIAILVVDFPDEQTAEDLELETPFDLLGLYEGIDLATASSFDAPEAPNRIVLFRRALLDYWAEHEETLGDLVTHVLVHEIGHHFGLSDDDMEAIEAAAR